MSPSRSNESWKDKIQRKNSTLHSPTAQAVFPMGIPGEDPVVPSQTKVSNKSVKQNDTTQESDTNIRNMSSTNVLDTSVEHIGSTNVSDTSTEHMNSTHTSDTSTRQMSSTHVSDTKHVHINSVHAEIATTTEILHDFKLSTKRETVEDTHTRKTFIVRNDLLSELDKLGKEHGRGFQTWFVNMAFERLLSEIQNPNKPKG